MLTKVENKTMLTEKAYDRIKKLVQVVLPAFATLCFTIGSILDIAATGEVVGIVAAITTFLGVCLGISSRNYESTDAAYQGDISLKETEIGTDVKLSLDPEDLVGKSAVRLKVKSS